MTQRYRKIECYGDDKSHIQLKFLSQEIYQQKAGGFVFKANIVGCLFLILPLTQSCPK